MTDKGLLEALSDDDTHFAGDLAGEQPLAVQELMLQAQRLKEKGWLLLQRNDQELALSQLNITPEGLEMAPNLTSKATASTEILQKAEKGIATKGSQRRADCCSARESAA